MLKDIGYFIRLSRPVNIVISWIAFVVACYIANDGRLFFLGEAIFWITGLLVGGVAAGGYWINDVYDFRIDRINKPHKTLVNAYLSVKKVLTVYLISSFFLCSFSAIYHGYYHGRYEILGVILSCALGLFFYARQLKRTNLWGNLLIAVLAAMVVILGGMLYHIHAPLVWIALFSFEITLIREIVKDIEDMKGDKAFQLQTLPIRVGIVNTHRTLWVLVVIFVLSCYIPFIYAYFLERKFIWGYLLFSLLLVQCPILFVFRDLYNFSSPVHYAWLSKSLKYLIFSGIASLFFLF